MNTFQSEQEHDALEFVYPQFKNIQQRISSYAKWPEFAKQAPTDLAESGLFYTGENDIVRCFCCDIGFAEWDPRDNPWTEHARHNPKCLFLRREKGQRFIDSIQEEWKKIYNGNKAAFDDVQPRIASFDGWPDDIEKKPEDLGSAGFALTGDSPLLNTEYTNTLIQMGFTIKNVKSAINSFIRSRGHVNFDTEDLIEFILDPTECTQSTHVQCCEASNQQPGSFPLVRDPAYLKLVNDELKNKLVCVICRKNERCMVFTNCGHRVTCQQCCQSLNFCPRCDKRIKKTVKSILS